MKTLRITVESHYWHELSHLVFKGTRRVYTETDYVYLCVESITNYLRQIKFLFTKNLKKSKEESNVTIKDLKKFENKI